jgi:O-antigen/teichoic acid export membrane protein
MSDSLGKKVGSGLRWSAVNTIVNRVGQLMVGIALARLVAPEEFGVYAAALVVMTVVQSVSELGVSLALVRATERSEVDRLAPVVTTLSIASGTLLGAGMALTAPLLANALGAPSAADPLRVLSLALVTAGFAAVPAALLQREFLQGRKLTADTIAFVLSSGLAIALAAKGYGVWALVWSRLVLHLVSAVLLFALAPARYPPGFDRTVAVALLRFGLPLAGASLVAIGLLEVDYMVIGPILGPTALGLYVLAFNISGWPVNAFSVTVRAVSLPGFANLRDDPPRFRASFGQALGVLYVPVIPFCVLLATLAGPIVTVVYGTRWSAAAAPLAFLAVLGAGRVATQLAYDFLVSAGESGAALRLNLAWLVALVPALIAGAQLGGIEGVGAAHMAILVLVVVPTHLVVLNRLGVTPVSIFGPIARPLAGGAAMVAVSLAVQAPLDSDLERLLIAGPVALAFYAAAVVMPLWRRHRSGTLITVAPPRPVDAT